MVKDMEEVPFEFHAQRDVKSKIYVYKICNQKLRPALGRNYSWFVRYDLDLQKMRQAAKKLIGTHMIFPVFAPPARILDRVRTIKNIEIKNEQEGNIEIIVEAKGF